MVNLEMVILLSNNLSRLDQPLLLLIRTLPDNSPLIFCIDRIDDPPPITSDNRTFKSLNVLYTNADQFMNKCTCDLLLA